MKTILVDLNVVLDYLLERDDFENAQKVIAQCYLKQRIGYLCAHEITTLSYFLEKYNKNRSENLKIISRLFKFFEVIETNKTILEKALASNIADFEDSVIVESAKEKKIDCIVTGNVKDFKNSQIKIIHPKDL